MEKELQKEILKVCMSKGFLLDKEMLEIFSELDKGSANEIIETLSNLKIGERVITKNLFSKNFEKIKNFLVDGKNKIVIEKFFINLGYEKTEISSAGKSSGDVVDVVDVEKTGNGVVKVLSAGIFPPKKIGVKDFVAHFRSRYDLVKGVLAGRDLEDLSSIRKIGGERGNYTIIAAILNKRITKNKNLFLEVEDMTGKANVLVNQNKKEIFEKARDLLVDDIVAFSVSGSSDMLFANDVIFPEAGLAEKKYGKDDEWVAFISDLHVGSTMFLEDNFLRFIKWLNGEEGDEKQKEIAGKVRYLIFNGDGVDGVGHFPGQDKWLNILDMKGQYDKMVELFKLIRSDIKIVFAPGNHDAVWVGEPQPTIGEQWAPGLYKMDNVTLVTNPSLVEIDSGFRILMYHGASMHGMINEIEYIRVNHGTDSPTIVGKEILKRRHLAPSHGSVDYIPCEEDALVIKNVPDILTTADLHRSEVSTYNNILIIATSCWQSLTPFQEKVGNNPDFCKVVLFNLKTREIKILDFSDKEDEFEEQVCEENEEGDIVCEVKNEHGGTEK
ncbi:hypothetical protein CMI37_26410 [Candidatus Pacearchaeota archaeon]|nr:hypothetical protein [Candidatus Pacearchaeota archaeon]|tara:strand:- start:2079 stop:3740 length:1662 start_codon:yes stop_codon:yes gene_type:complete